MNIYGELLGISTVMICIKEKTSIAIPVSVQKVSGGTSPLSNVSVRRNFKL